METCYIFGAGDFTPCTIDLTSKDLVIAADGGYDYLIRLGLRADVVLGDFDSVTSPDLWDDAICEKLTYPPEKDDTDMMLAIKLGFPAATANLPFTADLVADWITPLPTSNPLPISQAKVLPVFYTAILMHLLSSKTVVLPFQKMPPAWCPYFPSAIPAKMYRSRA